MLDVSVIIYSADSEELASGCLEACRRQVDMIGAEGKYSFSVLLDSGSISIKGLLSGDAPDLFIWIDSSLVLKDGTLASLLENSEFLRHRAIVVGSVSGMDGALLYGGRTRRGRLVAPDPVIPVPCRLYDTELLLVPLHALQKVSTPADIFTQGFFEYACGERAAKAGVARVVAPGVLAKSSVIPKPASWRDRSNPFLVRARSFIRAGSKELLRSVLSFFR